jgi:ribosomal protein L19E
MTGNAASPSNAMSNAWASTASKISAFMQTPDQVNTTTTGGGRKRKRKGSRKGSRKSRKGSKKGSRKTRRRRKQKMMGFNIF